MLPTFNNSPVYRFTTPAGNDYAIAFMPFKHQGGHIPQLQLLKKTGATWDTFKVLEDRAPMWGTDADEREAIPTERLVEGILKEFNSALPAEDRPLQRDKWEDVLAFILERVRYEGGELVTVPAS